MGRRTGREPRVGHGRENPVWAPDALSKRQTGGKRRRMTAGTAPGRVHQGIRAEF